MLTSTNQPSENTDQASPSAIDEASIQPSAVYAYTYHQPDGNRYVAGSGSVASTAQSDPVSLEGSPAWIVGAAAEEGLIWTVVLESGEVQAFRQQGDRLTPIAITPDSLPPGMPPLLQVSNGQPALITQSAVSPLTHPVPLQNGQFAYVASNGDVVLADGANETARLPVNALPDARILVDERDRLLLLTGPTDRYAHGIAGDGIEAASITMLETQPVPRVVLTITLPGQTIVEGIAPIWADLTGNGEREIIVTLSNAQQGAQVVAFNAVGEQVAAGPAIGQGYRWRHQIAVAPFVPDAGVQLAEVLTPHIGGTVGLYTPEGDRLTLHGQIAGYTSHVINSRNLDMALAADFDGDGVVELLLPAQDRQTLGAVTWESGSPALDWEIALDGQLVTNIAAVTTSQGRIAVAIGIDAGTFRVLSLSQQ